MPAPTISWPLISPSLPPPVVPGVPPPVEVPGEVSVSGVPSVQIPSSLRDVDITMGNRSESSGRFNFVRGADGDVSFDATGAHSVVTSATEVRGSWWADPTHGSRLRTLRSLTAATPSQAESMTFESLAQLEQDAVITKIGAAATAEKKGGQRTGRLLVAIRWTTPSGAPGSVQVGT